MGPRGPAGPPGKNGEDVSHLDVSLFEIRLSLFKSNIGLLQVPKATSLTFF